MSSRATKFAGQLADAREKVERACELLLAPSPVALDRCAPLFELAIGQMRECRDALAVLQTAEPAACLRESRRLRLAVGRARLLLENAAEYHQNWMRRLGSLSAGYDRRGEPAAVALGRRVVVKG